MNTFAPAGTIVGIDIEITRGHDEQLNLPTVIVTCLPVVERGNNIASVEKGTYLSRATVTAAWPFGEEADVVFTIGDFEPSAAELTPGPLNAYRSALAAAASSDPALAQLAILSEHVRPTI